MAKIFVSHAVVCIRRWDDAYKLNNFRKNKLISDACFHFMVFVCFVDDVVFKRSTYI